MRNRNGGNTVKNNLFQFEIPTKNPQEFVDITYLIDSTIEKSGIQNGILVIYFSHTTAGITINDNDYPDLVRDIIASLNSVFPVEGDYRHCEGNSHAHIKSSYTGAEKTIIVNQGEPILGTWQSVYFCEFDGPRRRKIFIKVMSD